MSVSLTDQKIVPHLWYDKEAKEAAEFYVSLFPDSKITNVDEPGYIGTDCFRNQSISYDEEIGSCGITGSVQKIND